jgi:flagellar biosynthesis protein
MPVPNFHLKNQFLESENKRLHATALGYDPEKDSAPRVLASGQGKIAEQIIALAQANGIQIREDPVLAMALSGIDINAEIPPELYTVVAEILAYVYRIRTHRQSTTHS